MACQISGKRMYYSVNGAGNNWSSIRKYLNLDPYLITRYRNQLQIDKDLNAKAVLKLLSRIYK